ncbi:MAG: TIR domain-containing protein [Candidatus Methanoperedens sp.]|nr:TIR domain-containing protein [Candidatus Methanoperedens sp.]MCZ7404867.1 TIR domain-containing protein [Candidatus Methanoperedens sp.]
MAEFKVFLCWSGERSKKVATAFYNWLPKVIQAIKPWMSEVDIPNGARWFSEISENLKSSQLGIICLTPENLKGEWIHFETGALATNKNTGLVCTYLFQVAHANLVPPLSEFQYSIADKDSTRKLIITINQALKENPEFKERALSEIQLKDTFEVYWEKLESELSMIETSHDSKKLNLKRDPTEVQNEILETVRNIERFLGTKGVWRSDVSGNLIDASGNPYPEYLRNVLAAYESEKDKKLTWVKAKVIESDKP